MPLPPGVSAAIDAVLAGGSPDEQETATLEFKALGRSEKETDLIIAQAAACLANATGGAVVVGVQDDARGAAALQGCELAVEKVQRRIYELTDPRLVVTVDAPRRPGHPDQTHTSRFRRRASSALTTRQTRGPLDRRLF